MSMSSKTLPLQSSRGAAGGGVSGSGSGKAINDTPGQEGNDPPPSSSSISSSQQQQQHQQTVDLNTLSYPQLAQLKKQLDDEVSHLTTSYQQLRAAQNKFRDCLAAIRGAKFAVGEEEEEEEDDDDDAGQGRQGDGERAGPAATASHAQEQQQQEQQYSSKSSASNTSPTSSDMSTTILVPLTTSLYVPGTLDTKASLLVDIGTGFFVSKSAADALDFYNRKVDELAGNLTKLDGLVQGKGRTVRVVEEALRQKVLASNVSGQGSKPTGDDYDDA